MRVYVHGDIRARDLFFLAVIVPFLFASLYIACILRMRVQWFDALRVSAYFLVVSRQKGKAQNGF